MVSTLVDFIDWEWGDRAELVFGAIALAHGFCYSANFIVVAVFSYSRALVGSEYGCN